MKSPQHTELMYKLACSEALDLPIAEIVAAYVLEKFTPAVRDAVILWQMDVLEEGYVIDGRNVDDVCREMGCSVFQALCVIDSRIREGAEEPFGFITKDRTHENPDMVFGSRPDDEDSLPFA